MGFRFGTRELADECIRQQDTNPSFQSNLKGLNLKILFVGTDCPGREDRQLAIDLEQGRFVDIEVSAKPSPSDLRTVPFDHTKYDSRVQAPQHVLVDVISGKVDLITAIQMLKIEGNIGKLMSQAAGFIGFIDLLGTMDIEP
jgi:hypothetical protein